MEQANPEEFNIERLLDWFSLNLRYIAPINPKVNTMFNRDFHQAKSPLKIKTRH